MAQSPQFNDSQNSLLAKIAANTGESQPKVGDGQHNLLFKIAQNTYASAVNGSGVQEQLDEVQVDLANVQSELEEKARIATDNYLLVQPQDNLAEKYQQFKNLTPSSPSPLLNGLLAFYKLGDTSDSSGKVESLINFQNVEFSNGKIGNAGYFNADNFLYSESNPLIESVSFSVSGWIKTSDNEYQSLVLAFADTSTLWLDPSGSVTFDVTSGGDGRLFVEGSYNDDQWHHFVGTYDGSIAKLYIDNNLEGSLSVSVIPDWRTEPGPSGGVFYIGGEEAFWKSNKQIDAVGLWSKALSEEEIGLLYNSGNGIEYPFFRSATNRGTMFVVPGTYPLSSELEIDEEYVDLVGLGAQFQSPAVIVSNNTLNVTANDVRVSGISVGTQTLKIADNKPLQVFENCTGGDNSFGGGGTASGTFVGCVGGNDSFGDIAIGNYLSCVSGSGGFGGVVDFSGQLLYSRLIGSGATYQDPSGSGIIRFCLDGDNNIVNADAD